MGSGATVIIIAFIRVQIVPRCLRDGRFLPGSSLLADAFLAALVIALFALMGSFALHVTPGQTGARASADQSQMTRPRCPNGICCLCV